MAGAGGVSTFPVSRSYISVSPTDYSSLLPTAPSLRGWGLQRFGEGAVRSRVLDLRELALRKSGSEHPSVQAE
jgi:hypothetical protein